MTNETQSYNTLRANVFLPRDRVDRVENICVAGMPDVNTCIDSEEVWIEIKTPMNEPASAKTGLLKNNHPLSQDQKNWFLRHRNAGGRGFIYVDSKVRRYLIYQIWADEINEMSHERLMLVASWSCPVPTPPGRWLELRKIIAGG